MLSHLMRTVQASMLCPLVMAALVLNACDGAICPSGTTEQLGHCVRNSELGDAEVGTAGEQASTGSAGTSAPAPANAGAGIHSDAGHATGGSPGSGGASGEPADLGASGSSGAAQAGASGAAAGAGGNSKPVDNEAGTSGGSHQCGDGVRDAGETCDGDDCPTSCPAATGCLRSKLTGSAASCDAECAMVEITETTAGDGCCPVGANASTDNDCPAHCGDGVLDTNEKCERGNADMPCPTSCDDNDPCTKDMLTGSAVQCTAACTNTAITKAIGGDMCCPSGANAETDSDCPTKCGDGVVTGSETCDPKSQSQRCPTSCDDGDACTLDKLNGSAAQCTAECSNTPISVAKSGDGCCPKGATPSTDNDCPSKCGDGVVTGSEECDPKAEGWSEWTCSADCTQASIYMPCASDADCHGTYFGKRPTCNLTYAVCTIPCVGSNSCPPAPGGLGVACASLGTNMASCVATGCKAYTDCGLGSSCVPLPLTGSTDLVCLGCDTHAECPTGTMCRFMNGGSFGSCR